ncbi:MAG: DUF4394 domain-containing protein [Chitinophagaceae bacterium]|nr:DUF4394 domain-containing protein [Chitinophagaceae bacterium]
MNRICFKHPSFYQLFLASMMGLLLSSCVKDLGDSDGIPEPPVFTTSTCPDIVFFGLTDDGKLNRYNAKAPGTVENTLTISGIPSGEKMISIDFRPATAQLYALASNSRLYIISLTDGVARPIGSGFTPVLNSQIANIDFNPTVDRIRLVTHAGQNLRLHPETGASVATDGNINGGTNPAITSIAYTNSRAGVTTTELFNIDVSQKKLYKQNPPNDGTLAEVGSLGIDFVGKGGFDISPDNIVSLATFTQAGKTRLYTINLMSGNATYINEIAANLIDIAIPTPPVAYGVDEMNTLHIFDPSRPQMMISKPLTGLGTGETVEGIDFRPATGELFAFTVTTTGTGRLYKLNTSTGAAAAVGSGFMVGSTATAWAFDFNPTVDRIRLVSDAGLNLRLNPNDGTIAAIDGNINPGTPQISGAAYTNNFNGTTSTLLYVMSGTKLFKQDPPNNGTLVEVGNIGISLSSMNGFDIGGRSGMAYAVGTMGSTTHIYSVNLTTGAFTAMGSIPVRFRAFAVGLGL